MPFGFTYVNGSGTINSVPANPLVVGNTLTWSVGDLAPLAVVTISYKANIPSWAFPSSYTNLAFASAEKSSGGPSVHSNLATSKVVIGQTFSLSTLVGGTVLGVSTGQVLGAVLPAAGSNTDYLILAISFIMLGLAIRAAFAKKATASQRKYAKNH